MFSVVDTAGRYGAIINHHRENRPSFLSSFPRMSLPLAVSNCEAYAGCNTHFLSQARLLLRLYSYTVWRGSASGLPLRGRSRSPSAWRCSAVPVDLTFEFPLLITNNRYFMPLNLLSVIMIVMVLIYTI